MPDAAWTQEDFERFIATARWTVAKTMPWNPHEYTARQWNAREVFRAACEYIDVNGVGYQFGKKIYTVVHMPDGYRYWHMPDASGRPVVLNRAVNK